jgi:hypothetical protein
MKMKLCKDSFRFAALVLLGVLLAVCAPHVIWACGGGGGGGGGGDGGGGDSDGAASSAIQPLSRQQIENIFGRIGNQKGLSAQTVETMVWVFKGKRVDPKQLYRLRQQVLESQSSQANNWASFVDGATTLVVTVDTVGYYTQFALSFVPGVGWVTTATLSIARSGADTYKQGGDAGQIVKSMAIDGAASLIIKGSRLGSKGGKALERASQSYHASKTVISKTVKKALLKRAKQHLVKGEALKAIKKYGKGWVKKGLTAGTNAVQNSAPSPTYHSSPSGGWGPHYPR